MYLIGNMSEVQRLFVRTFEARIAAIAFNLTTIYNLLCHILFFQGSLCLSLQIPAGVVFKPEQWIMHIREKWTSLKVEFFKLKMNVTQNSSNVGNVTVLSEEAAQLNSDDATWILTSAFIIFTMQSGFGLVESGLNNYIFFVFPNNVTCIFPRLLLWTLLCT